MYGKVNEYENGHTKGTTRKEKEGADEVWKRKEEKERNENKKKKTCETDVNDDKAEMRKRNKRDHRMRRWKERRTSKKRKKRLGARAPFAASLGSHRKPRPSNPKRPNLGIAPDSSGHQ